jgi:hypothetical protein
MLVVQVEDLVAQGMRLVAGMVGGSELQRLGLLKACHENLNGAGREMEGGGDVRRRMTETKAVPDLLADGLRERSRHEVTPKKDFEMSRANIPRPRPAQNCLSHFRA